ncbi:MAG: hypothetical protein JST40_01500 [Armatimonadetes bacterium]|nr:hypothetical protein [Armatimonadota bacterium]
MFSRSIFVLGATLITGAAYPSLVNYGIAFYSDKTQVSDFNPADPPICSIYTTVSSDTDNELLGGSLTSTAAHAVTYVVGGPKLVLGGQGGYNTISALQADYPAGAFLMKLNTTGGIISDKAHVPTFDFPNREPFLNAGTFSGLQLTPANQPATVTWPSFTGNGSAFAYTSTLQQIDITTGLYVAGYSGNGATFTSQVLPGSTLKSGHQYFYELAFLSQYTDPSPAFGTDGYITFIRRATGRFKVKALPGTISGQINLKDIGYYVGEPIVVEVLNTNSNVVYTTSFPINYEGWYAFDAPFSSGTYAIRFKGRHWLSNIKKSVNFGVGQDYLNVSLTNGDLDGDNQVTIFDYIVLNDYFDKSYLDADWNTVGPNGFAPKDADLDNDYAVSVFDYLIISNNFDEAGF